MTPIGKTQLVQNAVAQTAAPSAADKALREVAQKMEATFLAEMLKHAGLGEAPEAFGGGAGEDQFASFLRQAQADALAKSGGIGLAEHLFKVMKEAAHGTL